ncbi:MAG: TonB-dependent receptor [Terriglobales bacterium]
MNLCECPHIPPSTSVSPAETISQKPRTKQFRSANERTHRQGTIQDNLPREFRYQATSLAAILLILSLVSVSLAQIDRSGLSGTVIDPSGRVLPQAHVVAVKNDSGLRREATTSSSGTYDIAELPVGVYTITFDHDGFKSLTFVDVEQVIGRTRTLDATLQVSGRDERLEVSASSELLDRNTSAVTGLIEKKQAEELPLNGRNWASLAAYVPGAIDTGGSNQRSIRFAGRGLDDSNWTYDGIDATSIVNQTQRPWVRLAIPLDAIQEFRVDSLTASAEEGGTGGPQLDVTSPSGTNRFHGHVFEYLRNNVFDANEPAWASGGETQQPLRLNQFGGAFGGPIKRDKTFFFIAAEAYRQRWGYPVSGDVPSPALIATVSPSSPIYPIITAYPGPGPNTIETATSDPNIDLLTCSCTQVVNENSVMLRLDQHFSAATTGFMRFNYDRSVDTQPLSAGATDLEQRVSGPVNGALELLHVFNPNLVNEAKFGFNRSSSNTYNLNNTGILYQIAIATGPGPGFVTQNYDYGSIYVGNSFSWLDNLTWIHGQHTFKFGGEIRHIQLNQSSGEHGKITFSTVEDLAANLVSKASLTGALPVNHLRKNDYAGYAQDEYKWLPNLTLNLGVRYTVFVLFHEEDGLANPFDFGTCGAQGFCGIGASFGQQNYGDVDPRVGFAWAPRKDGRTVIRGGFGIYHEDGQLDDQNLPAKNEVPSYAVKSGGGLQLTYPVDSYFTGPGTLSPNAEQRNRKDSYVEQWSLSAQRELPANFVAAAYYMGSHGVHLLDTNVVNLIDPATGIAQYPAFAPAIPWRGSVGMSTYNGLSLALRRPFSHGLLVTANYTWSHEIDNGSNGSGDGDEISPQNPLCLACDTASGAWDARHVFNANAVYELPFGRGKPLLHDGGIAGVVAGNWEVTTTALARTGFPVNVLLPSSYTAPDGASGTQRPDLVAGVSLTPPGGKSIGEWVNPAAFAYPAGDFGNAPRDVARGPGTWQMDFGLAKHFPLTERASLEFRSEFFNIFNHPQLGPPQATCDVSTSSPTGCPTGFGSIITPVNLNTAIVNPITPVGSGTPREIQFALRLSF